MQRAHWDLCEPLQIGSNGRRCARGDVVAAQTEQY